MSKSYDPIIRLEHVSKVYNEYGTKVLALDDISLEISRGEFVSIVGPSGCGKSTMLHCMGLLDRPSSGTIYIEGKDTSKISGKEIALFRGYRLGFVFQNYNLIPRLTVLENVMLPGLIMGKNKKDVEHRAYTLLRETGISHRADHRGIHLSGGEQQKVAIARALINNPVIVLADEPTGALDTKNSLDIMNLLSKINREKRVTFIVVSHDNNISRYGNRKILLKDGKITEDIKKKNRRKYEHT
ncbi:ABC transporter ATP-binding protein [Euryarchaeota archaeon ex4484_162]|nr:MAG: ABC transporter ATP-binding protein [Euryarchaeota archaeon ex4484_162]RLF28665.1 MAG: ABC transporter ATP-binding protein [Thermoplasmata archaeon]RLF36967.1 MAG: ABC transporter ATP-binding protein [Thermoplasmata archaeon]